MLCYVDQEEQAVSESHGVCHKVLSRMCVCVYVVRS